MFIFVVGNKFVSVNVLMINKNNEQKRIKSLLYCTILLTAMHILPN